MKLGGDVRWNKTMASGTMRIGAIYQKVETKWH
jgi:hypothetical protein